VRSAFDVSSDDRRRAALVEAAKFARANGQLVAWNQSEQEYAIGVYHEETQQVEPLTDEQAEIDELAYSRADALGTGVVVARFSGSGRAQVFDVEMREGELQLMPVASVPIASPN
jgi:hypothetical protein